jgi:hypothetical protein
MTTAIEGGEGSVSRPGRSLPPGKTQYPLYRRLGGPQGRSGQVRKISPPPGFNPRTVQPVASRYTGYAIRPTSSKIRSDKMLSLSEVHLVKYLLYVLRVSQVTRYWTRSVMCVSATCSVEFRVLQPRREKGMTLN